MKAIGAGRKQIRSVYLRTAALLGALGAIAGAAARDPARLGADLVLRLLAVRDQRAIQCRCAGAHREHRAGGDRAAAGRAARDPPRRAAAAGRDAAGRRERDRPRGPSDRLLRRARFLPRTAQIGLRGVTRRRRRSAATVLQVGLAVATLLAFLSLATSVSNTVNSVLELLPLEHRGRVAAERVAPARHPGADRLGPRRRARPAAAAQQRQVRRPGRPGVGPAGPADVQLPPRLRPAPDRRRSTHPGSRGRRRAEHRPGHQHPPRAARRALHRRRAGAVHGRRDRLRPAGQRHGPVRPAHHHAIGAAHPRRSQRVLDPDHLREPQPDRRDQHAARGRLRLPRTPADDPDRVRRRGKQPSPPTAASPPRSPWSGC